MPASLAFPVIGVGAHSGVRVVTFKNAGTKAVTAVSVGLVGAGASSYSTTQTCGDNTCRRRPLHRFRDLRSEKLWGPGGKSAACCQRGECGIGARCGALHRSYPRPPLTPIPTCSTRHRATSISSFARTPRRRMLPTSCITSATAPIPTPSSTGSWPASSTRAAATNSMQPGRLSPDHDRGASRGRV